MSILKQNKNQDEDAYFNFINSLNQFPEIIYQYQRDYPQFQPRLLSLPPFQLHKLELS
jgi:hypothetical protein